MQLNSHADYTGENQPLAIIIIGASGDLAKRKTYPALFKLFLNGVLSQRQTIIYGFGRSKINSLDLRDKIRPFISHQSDNITLVNSFLNLCYYKSGSGYDDVKAFEWMNQKIINSKTIKGDNATAPKYNYLFYLAIPPNLFYTSALTITHTFSKTTPQESIRILFEKPFGKDTSSYLQLSNSLASLKVLCENQIYRIDHYLGKKMVRLIPSIRFDNSWAKTIWNRQHVEKVIIEVTETIGTDGRGGYFDQYGIIRDFMQNHLLQILTLVAMEPQSVTTDTGEEDMRDLKCKVISCARIDTCVLGQYKGYTDDETVPNDSRTPTFAAVRIFIDNDRWKGVPFILVAGKAMRNKQAEVRLVLREKEELALRIQPDCFISLTANAREDNSDNDQVKQQNMILNIDHKVGKDIDDAYSRLIHDSLKGDTSSFVRDDELKLGWELFTPLLARIEESKIKPDIYERGSDGPHQAKSIFHDVRKTRINDRRVFRSKL